MGMDWYQYTAIANSFSIDILDWGPQICNILRSGNVRSYVHKALMVASMWKVAMQHLEEQGSARQSLQLPAVTVYSQSATPQTGKYALVWWKGPKGLWWYRWQVADSSLSMCIGIIIGQCDYIWHGTERLSKISVVWSLRDGDVGCQKHNTLCNHQWSNQGFWSRGRITTCRFEAQKASRVYWQRSW